MSRGAYRSIHTVLIDGPDFQALPPHAKLVFLVLKLDLGFTGIDVLYPGTVEAQTGLSPEQTTTAMEKLAEGGWIQRERNLIWIVDGLKYEPQYRAHNPKHQQGIADHLNALPRLSIVNAFRIRYGLEPNPNANGIESKPEGNRSRKGGKEERREKEKREGTSAPDGATVPESGNGPAKPAPPEKPPSWVAEGVGWWTGNVGATTYPRFGKALTAAVGAHGWPDVFMALKCYVTECKARDKPPKPEWLASEIVLWIEKANAPPTHDDVLTPAAKRALGIVA